MIKRLAALAAATLLAKAPADAAAVAYRAAGLEPVVIAGSGHSTMVAKPAEFLGAVEGFVNSS